MTSMYCRIDATNGGPPIGLIVECSQYMAMPTRRPSTQCAIRALCTTQTAAHSVELPCPLNHDVYYYRVPLLLCHVNARLLSGHGSSTCYQHSASISVYSATVDGVSQRRADPSASADTCLCVHHNNYRKPYAENHLSAV